MAFSRGTSMTSAKSWVITKTQILCFTGFFGVNASFMYGLGPQLSVKWELRSRPQCDTRCDQTARWALQLESR